MPLCVSQLFLNNFKVLFQRIKSCFSSVHRCFSTCVMQWGMTILLESVAVFENKVARTSITMHDVVVIVYELVIAAALSLFRKNFKNSQFSNVLRLRNITARRKHLLENISTYSMWTLKCNVLTTIPPWRCFLVTKIVISFKKPATIREIFAEY